MSLPVINTTDGLFKRIPLFFIIDRPNSAFGKVQGAISSLATAGTVIGAAAQEALLGTVVSIQNAVGGQPVNIKNALLNKMIIPLIVNPQSLSVTKNPRVVKTLTKRGLLVQSWQSEPDVLNFSGRAASDRSFLILNQLGTIAKTMEDGSRNIVTMLYKFGGVYQGYLENFKTAIDANNPGVFDYTFDFQFVDQKHFELFLFSINTSTINSLLKGDITGKRPSSVVQQLGLTSDDLKNNSYFNLKPTK